MHPRFEVGAIRIGQQPLKDHRNRSVVKGFKGRLIHRREADALWAEDFTAPDPPGHVVPERDLEGVQQILLGGELRLRLKHNVEQREKLSVMTQIPWAGPCDAQRLAVGHLVQRLEPDHVHGRKLAVARFHKAVNRHLSLPRRQDVRLGLALDNFA